LEALAIKRFKNGLGIGFVESWIQQVNDDEGAPAALNGFGLWNVLVLVLMLLAYGYPIAQFVIEPSPAAMVHRLH